MSYFPQYPQDSRPDNGHHDGSPPPGYNDDGERHSPHSRLPPPPSVQVAYRLAQNLESDSRHVPSTPAQSYVGPHQYDTSPIQNQSYLQSAEQRFQPPASQYYRTSYPESMQQLSVPNNELYPVQSQNVRYPHSSHEYVEQPWDTQRPSSQYPQQQAWRSPAANLPPQLSLPHQHSHQQQPFSDQPHSHQMQLISNYARQQQPPSRYAGSGTSSSIAGQSLPMDDPGLNYPAGTPPSAPVERLVHCPRCETTYQARGRSGSWNGAEQYDTEPENLVGYGTLPPCPFCGSYPAR